MSLSPHQHNWGGAAHQKRGSFVKCSERDPVAAYTGVLKVGVGTSHFSKCSQTSELTAWPSNQKINLNNHDLCQCSPLILGWRANWAGLFLRLATMVPSAMTVEKSKDRDYYSLLITDVSNPNRSGNFLILQQKSKNSKAKTWWGKMGSHWKFLSALSCKHIPRYCWCSFDDMKRGVKCLNSLATKCTHLSVNALICQFLVIRKGRTWVFR